MPALHCTVTNGKARMLKEREPVYIDRGTVRDPEPPEKVLRRRPRTMSKVGGVMFGAARPLRKAI